MRLKPFSWTGALAAAMLVGLLLRLYAINFGLPGLYDPDELMFELGAIRMLSHGTLNPGWFGHPATTTMYGLAIVNMATFGIGHMMGWFPTLKSFGVAVYTNPAWMILPGRILMAIFGAGTVWQTGRLGRDLFDVRAGLMAAMIVASSPLCVAWAQVIRSDIMGSFFVLLALRAALRADECVQQQRSTQAIWRADAVVALWMGIAVATKWPMALGSLGMAGLMMRNLVRRQEGGMRTFILRGLRFGAMMVTFTVLTSPYLILAHDTVLLNLRGEAQMHHLGATGGSPLYNLYWYVTGPLHLALGWTGLGLATCGAVLGWVHKEKCGLWLLLPVVLGLGGVLCWQHLVWDRWALPLVPLLALFAGRAIAMWGDWLAAFGGRMHVRSLAGCAALLAMALVVVPMGRSDLAQARGRMNDTRQRASAWAVANIPAGSSLMIEHFAFDLYPQPWRIVFPIGDAGCVDVRGLLQGRIGYDVIDKARGQRSNLDYGTMAPAKRDTCRTDFAIITQYDRYKVEADTFAKEDLAYVSLLSQAVEVAHFYPKDGYSSGPVVRIFAFPREMNREPKLAR